MNIKLKSINVEGDSLQNCTLSTALRVLKVKPRRTSSNYTPKHYATGRATQRQLWLWFEEARENYRRMIAKVHPDKEGGSMEKSMQLNVAWNRAREIFSRSGVGLLVLILLLSSCRYLDAKIIKDSAIPARLTPTSLVRQSGDTVVFPTNTPPPIVNFVYTNIIDDGNWYVEMSTNAINWQEAYENEDYQVGIFADNHNCEIQTWPTNTQMFYRIRSR